MKTKSGKEIKKTRTTGPLDCGKSCTFILEGYFCCGYIIHLCRVRNRSKLINCLNLFKYESVKSKQIFP